MSLEALRASFLFANLSHEALEKISSFTTSKRLQQGEVLFAQGDAAQAFFVVSQGQLKIFKLSPSGEEQILHIHGPGDLIAEAAIFDKKVYPAFCQALKTSELRIIAKDPFLAYLKENWAVCQALFSAYSKRLRGFVSMIEDLTLKDVKQRLIQYLLKKSQQQPNPMVLKLDISKRELASLLGTIPETLSRVLRQLKEEGMIDQERGTLLLLDPKGLRECLELA